uniref:Glycosyltransferase family 92 protein n=1 Tax=Angiostrongylus cantonensis TaxID=6313 RepID=A0A158PC29_ANGCA
MTKASERLQRGAGNVTVAPLSLEFIKNDGHAAFCQGQSSARSSGSKDSRFAFFPSYTGALGKNVTGKELKFHANFALPEFRGTTIFSMHKQLRHFFLAIIIFILLLTYFVSQNIQIFFRRHCLVAQFLRDSSKVNYVLFMDSDIGVVNPKRRIEDFVDSKMEIIFYDRFFNWEVAAGSYLVKNSNWSQAFLRGKSFADYEYRLPKSFHGNDNGALHAYLAERILPKNNVELPVCLHIYNHTKNYADLFLYEACIRNTLGNNITFGKIKILRKGTAWVRDNWITNSKWNEERDFMIHNWKTQDLKNHSGIPVRPLGGEYSTWYNPIDGPLELSLCAPGNTTWRYDPNLVASREEIDDRLQDFARSVEIERQKTNLELKRYFNVKE